MTNTRSRALTPPFAPKLVRTLARGLRHLGYRTPIYDWRLRGAHPLKLDTKMEDPVPGNAVRGQALLNGRFEYASHIFSGSGPAVWADGEAAPRAYREWLFSFAWLRDLSAAGRSRAARLLVEAMMRSWIERYGRWHPLAWDAHVLGSRVGAWALHSETLFASSDMIYRSRILKALATETRHLGHVVGDAMDGIERIEAASGLISASLALPNMQSLAKRGEHQLEAALARFVAGDGGPRDRMPRSAVRLVFAALLTQAAYKGHGAPSPRWLQLALDRAVPWLHALSHMDGGLAQFNGAFAAEWPWLRTMLEASGASARPMRFMPHSGYSRLKRQRALVLVDAAPPPITAGGHAGTLAIEVSDGRDRIFVNIAGSLPGVGNDSDDLGHLAAYSASHSTLVLGQSNSSEVLADGRIGKGVATVKLDEGDDAGKHVFSACHDGYLGRHGLRHHRSLQLSQDGCELIGEDRIESCPTAKQRPPDTIHAELRFHLHPDIKASATKEGRAIILRLKSGHGWVFRCEDRAPLLEASIYSDQPLLRRRSEQIVVAAEIKPGEVFKWSLVRVDRRD